MKTDLNNDDHTQAFGVYFSSYQYMLDALEGKTVSVMLNHLLAGGIAGSASWVVVVSNQPDVQVGDRASISSSLCRGWAITHSHCGYTLTQYPVDVIKTRIQVFPERYTSMRQCLRLSLEQVSR